MKGLGADRPYWDALESGVVKLQQCAGCAKWNWPAVWRCGECGSWEHRWREVEPKGRIFSWTRTWHDFGAPVELGLPFVSVVVELDGVDGKRLIGTLAGADGEVKIGQPVTGEIHRVTFEGEAIPALRWQVVQERA